MKKKLFILAIIFVLCCIFISPVRIVASSQGEEDAIGENILEQLGKLDLEELEKYIQSLQNFSKIPLKDRLVKYIKGGSFAYDDFWDGMIDVLMENVKSLLPAFASIVAISLLCGILSSMRSHYIGSQVSEMIHLTAYISTLIPLLSLVFTCFSASSSCVSQMNRQMQLIFPILLTLMAASGGSVSASIYRPAVAFLGTSIVNIVKNLVFPITLIILVFSLLSSLSDEVKIKKFTGFFKSMNKWLIGVSISVFGMFFTVQGLTGATYDGVVKRATKYAIGTGVPIIGGFLSGGFDLAIAGSVLIKNSLGILGIFMLLAVLFEPLMLLIATNLLLRFTSAVIEPMGDSKISACLTETADNLNYCLAGLLFVAFLFFIVVVLMIFSSEVIL